MQVRIYKPIKNPMQSGHNKNIWVIEYVTPKSERFIESSLGRVASTNMMTEIKLSFDNQEAAIEFAKQHGYEYELIEPEPEKLIKKNYANNFTRSYK